MKKAITYFILILCATAFIICKSAQAQRVTTFNYQPEVVSDCPLVSVQFSNGLKGTFVLDTGSNTCLISDKLADQLKLERFSGVSKNGTPFLIDGKQSKMVMVNEFRLGDFLLNGPMVVVNSARLDQTKAHPIDGIIGTNLLQQFALLFDFQRHRITLWLNGNLTAEEVKQQSFLGTTCIAVPQFEENFEVFAIKAEFNSTIKDTMIIDTGAASTMILSSLSQRLRLQRHGVPDKHYTFYGELTFDHYELPELSFGQVEITRLPVLCPRKAPSDYPMRIGMDVLGKTSLLLDYPAHKLYAKLNTFLGVGIDVDLTSDNRLLITAIIKHSPASEGDMREGDEILEVNGLVVGKTTLTSIDKEMKQPEGTEIAFKIKHKGEDKPREVKLKVRKLL